jgi:PIN domain nuclease of toxin-antitoxin system
MRLLVDTQCWLWMNAAPERLSPPVRRQIERNDTELFFSAASAWEIAIKFALGKLPLPEPPAKYVPNRLRLTRTAVLAITDRHALHVADLPSHHRDPFDRLIIAQAQIERLRILTADPQFDSYDVDVLAP